MFGAIDQELLTWAKSQIDQVNISLRAPPLDNGVSLYLLSLSPLPPERTTERPPLQVRLNYLVSCWEDQPDTAHDHLSSLLFAAMQQPSYTIRFDLPENLWTQFGTYPHPAFLLSTTAAYELPQPNVPRVRYPLKMESVGMVSLHGFVTGPDATPIAGAYVILPALRRSQYTTSSGEFIFPHIPNKPVRLLVKVQGAEQQTTVEPLTGTPHHIHFESFE